jgi:NADH-ubiquinone oxidoreductase chain 5
MYAHEPSFIMLVPLLVLVLGAIFVGYIFKDMFVGLGSDFFGNILNFDLVLSYSFYSSEFLPVIYKQLPFYIVYFCYSSLFFIFF